MYQEEETSLVSKRIADLNGLAVGKRQPKFFSYLKKEHLMEIHIEEDLKKSSQFLYCYVIFTVTWEGEKKSKCILMGTLEMDKIIVYSFYIASPLCREIYYKFSMII